MAKLIKREEANLLWSDEEGDLRKKKGKGKQTEEIVPSQIDLKIQLEKNKRGGKTVSVIMPLPYNPQYFQKLTKDLKKLCGTGGAYKESSIEIQGDHREKLKAHLEKMGFKVKLSGG
jgi:translation initiation factor 1